MEINLIPRRSPFEKYRVLIIFLLCFLLLALIASLFLYNLYLNKQIADADAGIKRVLADSVTLRAERTVKREDVIYNNLLDQIAQIKGKEQDYGRMLDRIAALLSNQTKVAAAEMDAAQGVVTLSVTSDSIVAIADYAELLRHEKWAKQVLVEKIQNNKKDSPSPAPDAAASQPYSTTVRIELQEKAGGGS